jgi:oligopeptide transport system permease protein
VPGNLLDYRSRVRVRKRSRQGSVVVTSQVVRRPLQRGVPFPMATRTTAIETSQLRTKPRSLWGDAFGRLIRNRLAMVGGAIVIILLLLAIFGPLVTPFPYDQQNIEELAKHGNLPLPPLTDGHLLGTDELGRDIFSRLLDGARISMTVAFIVQIVVLLIGVPIGAAAAWFGGRVDQLLMRFTDIAYAFPSLLFVILLSVTFRDTWFGQALDGLLLIFVAIGIVAWVDMARLVRGQLLSLKEQEFVDAARAVGVSDFRIVTRHLLPNAIGPMIVVVTLGIPSAILTEATLGYLGIGAQPPRASWGTLINEGLTWMQTAPWMVLFPAIAIAIALLSFTFLGDGLRDALDPRLQGRQ